MTIQFMKAFMKDKKFIKTDDHKATHIQRLLMLEYRGIDTKGQIARSCKLPSYCFDADGIIEKFAADYEANHKRDNQGGELAFKGFSKQGGDYSRHDRSVK